ncbi:substrate-binding protein [Pararhodobacter oceanensis]|uniref:Aliphatic amidase expression-regulating protein n=1 Tax=Pararhodobacter oceanensis TaxID=2172121 RepID=A0A2T8HXK4_9RHOB|nr:substrate-binding protein [Pararhodobacter oceanensis]PVH30160.1 aliphatic amidase expression-regulating protein [Pararhodobacter oceanensis]
MASRLKPLASPTRRDILKYSAGGMALATLGAPSILRAQEVIPIGILQPLSGGLELLGHQGAQGTEMALLEANEAGGVLGGRMFEIIRADTETDPTKTVERSNELIRARGAKAVVGPVTSAARDAIQSIYERFRTPLIYATDYEGGVCSPYLTCYSALPAHQVSPLVDYALENDLNSFFLLGSDYNWPQLMNAQFRATATERGATVVDEEYGAWGAQDYAPTLRKIERSGADTVVLTIVGADAITFLKQFAASPLKGQVEIICFGFSENYLSGLTNAESQGIIGPANFVASLDKPEARDLVARIRARYGEEAIISNTVDAHYTATRLLIEGIKRAESIDTEAFSEAMLELPVMSGNGEVEFRRSDRHAELNGLIVSAQDGQMVVERDLGRIEAPSQCS